MGAISLLAFCAVLGALGESANPCCHSCEPGKEKYYTIPDPKGKLPQCGECCLQPSRYKFWKLFEPALVKGDCASQGFTKYVSTETDGVWPAAVTNDRYVRGDGSHSKPVFCPEKLHAVYADMHDGDKKEITISGTSLSIKPSGNNQTWLVQSEMDPESCSAVIDFNVPGKPSPPPVSLTATLWWTWAALGKKTELEFTDPSGTLPAGPLNLWVDITKREPLKSIPCVSSLKAVYADMHDGDKKEVTISGTALTIRPSGNDQTWVVHSSLDTKTCSAVIDFNVKGKPSPPPVKLTASLWWSLSTKVKKSGFEFRDPSGTLADASFPLNHWVELSRVEVTPGMYI